MKTAVITRSKKSPKGLVRKSLKKEIELLKSDGWNIINLTGF